MCWRAACSSLPTPPPVHIRRAFLFIKNWFRLKRLFSFCYSKDAFFLKKVYLWHAGPSLLCVGFLSLQCMGFSCGSVSSCRSCNVCNTAQAVGMWASVALKHMLQSASPGIESMSPALAGEFLTSGPPGKSLKMLSVWEDFACQAIHILV